jgi:hypothetical protein
MAYLTVSSWYEGTHKAELQELKQKSLDALNTMLKSIERTCIEDEFYLQEALKHYDILVTKMSNEDQKVTMNHFSINHICMIAQQLKEIEKTKKSEIFQAYIQDIYRIMRVIHKSHTNSYKWEKYDGDVRFIDVVVKRY